MMAQRRGSTPLYRLMILGDAETGKTCTTIQFCMNRFIDKYNPTIEDSFRKRVLLDDQPSLLEILEVAGKETSLTLRENRIRDAEGFILIYSVTSQTSFNSIESFYSEIQKIKGDDQPYSLVLVANKADLGTDRVVSYSKGQQLAANKLKNAAFYEISATNYQATETAFMSCAMACKRARDNMSLLSSGSGQLITSTSTSTSTAAAAPNAIPGPGTATPAPGSPLYQPESNVSHESSIRRATNPSLAKKNKSSSDKCILA